MRRWYAMVLMALIFLGGVCLVWDAAPARAESEIEAIGVEHGKLGTADATPVDPGHVELEFGYSYAWSRRGWDPAGRATGRNLDEEHALGLSVTVGVVENLDVGFGLDYLWLHDEEGDGPKRGRSIGDLALGGRYRFYQNDTYKLEIAYNSGFTVPTGSRTDRDDLGTSQEFWSWDNSVALSKDWDRWTANAELGYSLPFGEKRGEARGSLIANMAVGYQLLSWLQPEVEAGYSRDYFEAAEGGETLALTAGLVMPISDRLRVNVGVRQSLWGRNTDRTTAFMLAVKLAF